MSQPTANSRADKTNPDGRLSDHEFAQQFQTSFRVLWLVAVGIVRDRDLAEEVVQEAGLIALQKLDDYSPKPTAPTETGSSTNAPATRYIPDTPNSPDANNAPNVPPAGFTAWMSQIVRFVALNESRKGARRRAVSMDPVALDQMQTGGDVSAAAIGR